MKTAIQIPEEIAGVFDSRDYNNQRNLLYTVLDRTKGNGVNPDICFYVNKMCDVCNYLRKQGETRLVEAIRKLTQIGIGRKTKLADLLN